MQLRIPWRNQRILDAIDAFHDARRNRRISIDAIDAFHDAIDAFRDAIDAFSIDAIRRI